MYCARIDVYKRQLLLSPAQPGGAVSQKLTNKNRPCAGQAGIGAV